MKQVFYIVIVSVLTQALTFTYVKGAKIQEAEAESLELEDYTPENDSSEETEEEVKGNCPFWEPFLNQALFFGVIPSLCHPSDEYRLSHILPVDCPPPRY